MPDHEIFKEHDPEDCFYSCRTVHDFMRLTDEMVHTIIGLEEEPAILKEIRLMIYMSAWYVTVSILNRRKRNWPV